MATQPTTISVIIAQSSGFGLVTAKKMFGEYGLFLDGKMVALVCDDELFVKITDAGHNFAGPLPLKPPYPGAKPCFAIPRDRWDDGQWLSRLLAVTTAALPKPKKKAPRNPG